MHSPDRIARAIVDAGCLTEKMGEEYVNLDALWFSPATLKAFSNSLTDYLLACQKKVENTELTFTRILLPVKVYGAFGAIPLFMHSCVEAGIPFAVWKEWAEPATGRSRIYGKISLGDRLLIAHDVINYGATPVKIIEHLSRLSAERDFQVVGVLAIVDRQHNGVTFIEKETGKRVKAICTWTDLIETAHGHGRRE